MQFFAHKFITFNCFDPKTQQAGDNSHRTWFLVSGFRMKAWPQKPHCLYPT